jgi:hypothetical protein
VGTDQRDDTRLEIKLEGTGSVSRQGKDFQIEVVAQNISAWGAFCVTDTQVSVGEAIRLRLEWDPDNRQSDIAFNAVGEIVRVERQPKKKYGFGIRFDEIPVLEGED